MSDFLDVFEDVFSLVSAPTRIEYLDYEQNWRLLIQVLLGHPPIRGGIRPRDFPIGHHHERALQLASALCHARVPYAIGSYLRIPARGSYSLHEWCIAFALLSLEEERQVGYRFRIRIVLEKLQDVLYRADPERGRLFHDTSCLMFGLRAPEMERVNPQQELFQQVQRRADVAALSALLSHTSTPLSAGEGAILESGIDDKCRLVFEETTVSRPSDHFRSHHLQRYLCALDELAAVDLWLITIKGNKIQKLLDRCKLSFIRRGASAWCSQSLALLRDELLCTPLLDAPPMLLSDSDAVVTMVTAHEIDSTTMDEIARTILTDSMKSTGALTARFPKLQEWRDQAEREIDPDGEGENWRALARVHPDFSIQVRQTNLLEMALDGQRWREDHEYEDAEGEARLISLRHDRPASVAGHEECDGLVGCKTYRDEGFRLPPWYEDHNEKFGWEAVAYSMVGGIYRMTADRGLAADVEDLVHEPIDVRALWKRRCKALSKAKAITSLRTALVHIDGDRIGRLFIETPSIARPAHGIGLESMLRYRFVGAVKKLIERTKLPLLPVDLLYLGGDDLMLRLPADLLDEFADAFAQSVPRTGDADCPLDRLSELTFTIVAVEYDSVPRVYGNESRPPETTLKAMRRLSPLMKLAKKGTPGSEFVAKLGKFDADLDDGATLEEFRHLEFGTAVRGVAAHLYRHASC